jgi:mercuric reductase
MIECGVVCEACRKTEAGVELTVRQSSHQRAFLAEKLLVATGRSPNVEHLGLTPAGVRRGKRGAIEVDDRMRTSRPGTYADGDVDGPRPVHLDGSL